MTPWIAAYQVPLSSTVSQNLLKSVSIESVMLSNHLILCLRRQWQPTPVFFPGKSYGQRSLVGCSPWGHKESDMTERLHFHFSLSCIGEGNGNPFQCSCLENPRDSGAWWAAVYGVAQRRTQLKQLSSRSSILCHPLHLLLSVFPSIRVFSSESAFHIRWPNFWSFSLSNSSSKEYLGLMSLQSMGLSKSLFQHQNSKASILQHPAFFMIQLSFPYMATRKTIAFTI